MMVDPPTGRRPKPLPQARVTGIWERMLLTDKKGEVKRNLANVITILSEHEAWKDALAWDEFAERIIITRACPAGPPGQWTDVCDTKTAVWLQRSRWHVEAGPEMVATAVRDLAEAHHVHPVRDWLTSLSWDGTKRIDSWLDRYLGVEKDEFSTAIGRKWLVAAVARVFVPGCQVDTMLILEGDQGLRKSSAMRTLAGDEWFLDTGIDVGDPNAAHALRRRWIVELSELAAVKGSEVERTKQFVSTRVDSYRPPYGRHVLDHPRQCVLVGSTNSGRYLKDETGNRRFWPVRVTRVDLEALAEARSQLWAEAVVAYRSGERWYLDSAELNEVATEAQESRRIIDPWEESVGEWLNNPVRHNSGVRTSDVLGDCLKLEVSRRTRADEMRIGSILSRLGWERKRVRHASSRTYVYFPKPSKPEVGQIVSKDSPTGSNGSPIVPTGPTNIHDDHTHIIVTKGFNGTHVSNGDGGDSGATSGFLDWLDEQGVTRDSK